MKRVVFGEPITAVDVERLRADGPTDFVRLCGALITQALAERGARYTPPEISERTNVRDGGVDARYVTPLAFDVPETGGVVGPGITVHQFKYRDTTTQKRPRIIGELARQLQKDLKRSPPACDRYVLMTNVHLTGAERARLRRALLEAHPPLASKRIVIQGAAEIASLLNTAPRLRHLFFSAGALCSLEVARAELRASYAPIGWPEFGGRERERRAILAFAEAPDPRLLTVLGPPHIGKTRLAIEALEPHAASVLWAAEPEGATLDLFRDLDTGDLSMILVVDRCPAAALAAIRERALARTRLKTIAIGVGRGDELGPDEPGVLRIGRLDSPAAARLVRAALPAAAPLQEAWVVEAAAGNPGLVLHIAALLRVSAVSTSADPDDVRHRLGSLIESHYLGQLAPAVRQALEIVSLLPVVGLRGTAGEEFDALCSALGVLAALACSALPELRELGLVRERGHFVEVIPPLLAEHVASRALRRPDALLDDPGFRVRLGPLRFRRFLERLRDLPSDDVQRAIARLFLPDGWFPDLDSLGAHIERFRVLAPAAPEASLGCLERLLGGLTPDELRNRAAGDLGRSVVATLDDLALRRKTFGRAARLLLALAEAENKTWSDSARGAFGALFHPLHPEVAAPPSARADVLKGSAASASARRRAIVAQACGAAFSEDWVLFHHEPKGPEVPGPAYRPRTWEEVREYATAVLEVLRSLAQDGEREVEQSAIESLLGCLLPFVELSLLPDGFHALGEAALETAERIGRDATSARRRALVVGCLGSIRARLEDHGEGWAPETRRNLVERLRELLDRLTTGSLKDLLWRWVGPASLSLEDERGDERRRAEMPSLAEQLAREPERLAEHLDWLTSDEAEHWAGGSPETTSTCTRSCALDGTASKTSWPWPPRRTSGSRR